MGFWKNLGKLNEWGGIWSFRKGVLTTLASVGVIAGALILFKAFPIPSLVLENQMTIFAYHHESNFAGVLLIFVLYGLGRLLAKPKWAEIAKFAVSVTALATALELMPWLNVVDYVDIASGIVGAILGTAVVCMVRRWGLKPKAATQSR